jgi:hypothetical protein|tara:strand:- start:1494 stop:1682 length:189 start_codon:yes stop_codon:yes gene_type:complete
MSGDWSVYNNKHCKICSDRIRLSQYILYDGTCFACLEGIRVAEREDKKKEIEALKRQVDWDD